MIMLIQITTNKIFYEEDSNILLDLFHRHQYLPRPLPRPRPLPLPSPDPLN